MKYKITVEFTYTPFETEDLLQDLINAELIDSTALGIEPTFSSIETFIKWLIGEEGLYGVIDMDEVPHYKIVSIERDD